MSEDKTTIEREYRRSGGAPRASLIVYHRDGAKVATLARDASLVVGRAHPADVVVHDASLSRQHARFGWDQDGFFVEDLQSTNGTRLQGQKIAGRVRLPAGEAVTIGDVIVALQVLEQELPGIDGHDKLRSAVDDEVVRSKQFGRSFTLAMVRADRHLRHWVPTLRAKLRAVDRIGAYSDDAVLVLMPEQSTALDAPGLRIGCAVFPADGQSAEELIDAARSALRGERRTSEAPPAALGDPRMREVWDTVSRVAPSALPVVIHGETGTGKELVARALHRESGRRGPLRAVNCAALPATLLEATLFGHEKGAFTGAERAREGVFEQARGGTVFLDEIGELAPAAQAALLRVLESKTITRVGGDRDLEVDVRVVAATHRDLEAMCEAGTFRWDLLYRLNTITIQLPPLRDRPGDILPLAELFIQEAARENGRGLKTIEPRAAALLRRHRWPGNVRELRNVIERAVVIARGDAITVEDLPPRLHPSEERRSSAPPDGGLKEQMRAYEVQLIVDALKRHGGNQTEAARALQMPVRTLAHKMQTYGIKKTFER